VSRPKSAAVKNIGIDIGDSLGSKISVNINIGKGDIDPALRKTGSNSDVQNTEKIVDTETPR